jgi:hypothetical protein
LIELGPAFGDSCGDEGKEVIQEGKDELILWAGIVRKEGKGLIVQIVSEGRGKEGCNIGPYIDLRVFNQQSDQIGILSEYFLQARRIFLDILRQREEQLLESRRLQPEAKG